MIPLEEQLKIAKMMLRACVLALNIIPNKKLHRVYKYEDTNKLAADINEFLKLTK